MRDMHGTGTQKSSTHTKLMHTGQDTHLMYISLTQLREVYKQARCLQQGMLYLGTELMDPVPVESQAQGKSRVLSGRRWKCQESADPDSDTTS